MKKFHVGLLLLLLSVGIGAQARKITSAEAHDHVGERLTVCGLVAGSRFVESAKSKPTFLNFDKPYPNHTFSIVIFEADRSRFSPAPEKAFDGKRVCVTGTIRDYRGKPEMVVKDPGQIVVE